MRLMAIQRGISFQTKKKLPEKTNQVVTIWPEYGEGRIVQFTENNSIRII